MDAMISTTRWWFGWNAHRNAWACVVAGFKVFYCDRCTLMFYRRSTEPLDRHEYFGFVVLGMKLPCWFRIRGRTRKARLRHERERALRRMYHAREAA